MLRTIERGPHDNGGAKAKFEMPKGADELMGFVPFKISCHHDPDIALIFTHGYARLTTKALAELGMPDYVNVFIDYLGKRLMVTPAKQEDPNAMIIGIMPKTKNRLILNYPSLIKEICSLTDMDCVAGHQCEGHKAQVTQPTLIFDLKKITKRARYK